jgi:hypothetical protein
MWYGRTEIELGELVQYDICKDEAMLDVNGAKGFALVAGWKRRVEIGAISCKRWKICWPMAKLWGCRVMSIFSDLKCKRRKYKDRRFREGRAESFLRAAYTATTCCAPT